MNFIICKLWLNSLSILSFYVAVISFRKWRKNSYQSSARALNGNLECFSTFCHLISLDSIRFFISASLHARINIRKKCFRLNLDTWHLIFIFLAPKWFFGWNYIEIIFCKKYMKFMGNVYWFNFLEKFVLQMWLQF